ncbi:Sulfotransferase domain protein [Posidoniimonas corsicana]|uniref:Sulfotransferase domain protein n=1 Tax=Posidoniimonas corsicana TaxID=1938618 RepID=A0A5C5V5F0_9BACT|nr:Sulfotransferase domain protein [Posidoniimonas corsicana]
MRAELDASSKLAASSYPPAFIVGAMNRSGTNFLADIIQLLPGWELPALTEDYLLEHSDLLVEYVNRSDNRWKTRISAEQRSAAVSYLGRGLLEFIRQHCESKHTRLIMKTPRPWGIENFDLLFPSAKLIIIVRDGRDTVESASRSFTYAPPRHWMRQWRNGAKTLLEFMATHRGAAGKNWTFVRYEDLVEHPRRCIPQILAFLGVDDGEFDWTKFDMLPLRGSSTHRGSKRALHWEQVPKPAGFRPIDKWRAWSWWRKAQFKWIAGRELIDFGYATDYGW